MYEIVFTKAAVSHVNLLKSAKLDSKVKRLIELMKNNPYQNPPPYEKLVGDMKGFYARRINYQHRLVYQVFDRENKVKVVSMWSHYEN